MAQTCRERHARYLAELAADPDDRRHGTQTGYAYGCRCERCLEAGREHNRKYAERRKEMNERMRKRMERELFQSLMEAAAQPQKVHIHGVGDVLI